MKPATGAQLWSLRNVLREEPEATFEKLATAGYAVVEPAGFSIAERTIQSFNPDKLKKMANSQGLQMVSAHFQFNTEEAFSVCDCAASMGMKYIVRSFSAMKLSRRKMHIKKPLNR
ncbi:hypothetical protein LWM68_35205 [Niabella sp. W65]|nr:hypothetical protein [Niabella sp. W65]MCH7367549.1 hypothetical protein [Niabella sp. W65]ULT43506.1 hypothetical protein KRR40_08780 [Niabella sp. I65]